MELGEMIGDVKQKGLTKHELQRLPTTIYKADESNGSTECHICMGDYETGDSLKILPCFHSYHGKCIDKWIKVYFSYMVRKGAISDFWALKVWISLHTYDI